MTTPEPLSRDHSHPEPADRLDPVLGVMLGFGVVGLVSMIVVGVWASRVEMADVPPPATGLREAYEVDPDDAYLARDLAWALIDADSAAAAVVVATRAISLAPDHPDGHVALGSALAELQRWDESFEALQEALRIDVDYGPAHFYLTDWYYWQGMWPQAEAQARLTLEVQPNLVGSYGILALSMLYQDRDAEADVAIDEGLVRAPRDVYLHGVRAEIFRRTARPVEAVEAFRRQVQLDPDHAVAWVNIGRLEHIMSNHEEAVEALERVRELDPEWFAGAELEQSMLEASREGRPYNR